MTPVRAVSSKPPTILFVHSGQDWVRGSERVLLDLAGHIPSDRFQSVAWCDSEVLRNACRSAGVALVTDPFPGPAARPFWRVEREKLRQAKLVIARTGARLLHVNSLDCLPWAIRAARASRIGVVAHLHLPTTSAERLWSGVHQADVIIGVSRYSLEWAESDGLPRSTTRIIYDAVFPERLERGSAVDLRRQLGVSPEAFVATTVGSLIPRKDIETVIRAVQLAAQRNVPIHLLVLGTGEDDLRLHELAGSLGLSERVHFLGNREDVGAILRDATQTLVSAAREETLGLNVIEAGYFGLPCVVSDIPPHREIVARPPTGLCFSVGDAEGLAAHLTRLHAEPVLREQLGGLARIEVRRRFMPDRFIDEFTNLYDEVLTLRRPRLGWLGGVRLPGSYWRFGLKRMLRAGEKTS